MSVYVDDPIWPFGRMMMCHMVADIQDELVEMARTIGVAVFLIQKIDTPDEHFDICKSKRAKAIAAGAKAIDCRVLLGIVVEKRDRAALDLPGPA